MVSEPTVFIVDDDAAVRDSLRWLVASVGLRAESHTSARAFLDAFDPDRPGCLVLDVRMPVMSGLDLQDELKARKATLPVIIITGHGDVPAAVRALKAGAVDFIEKPFNNQALLDRIQQCLEEDARRRREHAQHAQILKRRERLTPRQREVMALVVAGQSNKMIARKLGISLKTAEVHRARVIDKMEAESLAALVEMALTSEPRQGKP